MVGPALGSDTNGEEGCTVCYSKSFTFQVKIMKSIIYKIILLHTGIIKKKYSFCTVDFITNHIKSLSKMKQ